MAKVTEHELTALKAKYLAAHSDYDRCVATLSQAGLGSAALLPEEILSRLAKAFADLQLARHEYRAALFDVAFAADEALS
ncbi:MAG TPA: hypothetical protein VM692_10325 [Gammaproteobacteria bacterium]|nr:hypothetical protein [Gammaproteobacteria bacterium]